MKRISTISLILVSGFLVSSVYAQEQITITTYYPAPYGSYREMTVSDRQAIGDVNMDGRVDANDMAVDNKGNPIPGSLAVAQTLVIESNDPNAFLPLSILSHRDCKIKLQSANPDPKILWNYIELWNAGANHREWYFGQDEEGRFVIQRWGLGEDTLGITGNCEATWGKDAWECKSERIANFEGNVGIHTTRPDARLTVDSGTGHKALRLYSQNRYGTAIDLEAPTQALVGGVLTFAAGKRYRILSSADTAAGNPDAGKFKIQYSGDLLNPVDPPVDRLVIDRNGYVGIGTTAPSEKLEVQGRVKIVDGNQGSGRVLISDANGVGSWRTLTISFTNCAWEASGCGVRTCPPGKVMRSMKPDCQGDSFCEPCGGDGEDWDLEAFAIECCQLIITYQVK